MRALSRLLGAVDRAFDWLFSSRHNPLYRSGTLAVGLLAFVVATGFYLLFFYRLSAPYESVLGLSEGFFGSLIRSLHRYASDAAVVAIAVHALRMLAEQKTWGPRILAWMSGVLMVGGLLLSGWSGYVMVWDRHGQILAIAGARMIDSLNLLSEPLLRSFSGVTPVQPSFFFMNLFLHVAIPLGMIGGLWLHTAKMARSIWLPSKPILWVSLAAFVLLSILVPAPLASAPDLLRIYGNEPTDLFYNFWLPLDWLIAPKLLLLCFFGSFVLGMSMSFWWKPRRPAEPPKSQNDQLRCTGCGQCASDCPYEAISMVARTEGSGSEKVSLVSPALCVSCGLCSGSCSQLAIGPPDRSARAQLERIKAIRAGTGATQGRILLISCGRSFSKAQTEALIRNAGIDAAVMEYDCLGTVHPAVLQMLQASFAGVFALGCPESLCQSREGVGLFRERMFHGRGPADNVKIDHDRLQLCLGTSAEGGSISRELRDFALRLQAGAAPEAGKGRAWFQILRGTAALLLLLAGIAMGSAYRTGREPEHAFLRVSWRMPRQAIEDCRVFTEAELAKIPRHLRQPKECKLTTIPYLLKVDINGQPGFERKVAPRGVRGDRPMFVEELLEFPAGEHEVKLSFAPAIDLAEGTKAVRAGHEFRARFRPGRAVAVGWDAITGMYHRE